MGSVFNTPMEASAGFISELSLSHSKIEIETREEELLFSVCDSSKRAHL